VKIGLESLGRNNVFAGFNAVMGDMSLTTDWSETERLSALDRMELMDTAPEPEFDELVEIAAAICEVPMSLVTLLDERRQWFKAAIGVKVHETPRQIAFCAHTIMQPEMMVVEDATRDPRFRENPLVTGDMSLRFYAGMPIASPDGFPLGTLCVLDRIPRKLTVTQVSALQVLGRQVNARMELRIHRLAMERALRVAEEARAKQAASEQRFQTFMDSAPFISFLKDAQGRMIFYNQVVSDRFNVSRQEWLGKTDEQLFSP
jgi:GAF domain-containing protein